MSNRGQLSSNVILGPLKLTSKNKESNSEKLELITNIDLRESIPSIPLPNGTASSASDAANAIIAVLKTHKFIV